MRKKPFLTNLQVKVMLLFVAIALAPLGIMGAFAIKTAEELILSMVRNQIQHVAVDKAALLERWISERKADLEVVAGSSIMRSLDPALIAPYLELVRDRYKVYGDFIVLSREGGVIYDSSRRASRPHLNKWFHEALAGNSYMSDINFNPEQKKSFFLISTPVLDASGAVKGAVCATVGTNVILSMVLSISLGETGECYLVNREGTFLAHKDPNRILAENIAQSDSFKNIFNTRRAGITYIDYRGIEVLGASARVAGTDWALVAEQDKDEAFRGAARLKRYLVLVAAMSALGALSLAWLLSHYVVNPIRKLSLAAGCLARGEFDQAHIKINRTDEIGALSNAFEDMANQLQDRQRQLEQRMVLQEAELEETGVKLKATQQAAVRSQQLASLGRLASGVAHEIRTPLTSLKLFLESVESEIEISPEYVEDFQVAMGQIKRMEATINRFLDFARPQDPVFSWIDVRELIEDALLVIGPKARQQETAIHKHLHNPLPKIVGDEKQLGEVLLNLMVNALEAMASRGRLGVSAGPGELAGKDGGRRCVRIDISDTGPGIPAEEIGRLFEPFFTTKATGAGLGLAIVDSTVQRHGGEVVVHSSPGEGTTFSVLIPADGEDGKDTDS
ncbi:MAG: cache domain-containing protein [Deltaproteobacteria bacterium]|nr:cache domain-containing protein [Deltaproteobacteria bacterium]